MKFTNGQEAKVPRKRITNVLKNMMGKGTTNY